MLKLTLAAIAAALLTPALAHGATIRGTVAAKQAHRQVLVIASRHGKVTSARVSPRQLRRTRLGMRLVLHGKRLVDGSLHVRRMRRIGVAKRARMHVVVVKAKARRLLVAGGGTAFPIRLARGMRMLSSAGKASPGEKITTEVEFSHHGTVGTTVQQSGQAPMIDFSGVVTAIGATSITVSSDGIATVVQLPTSVGLPLLVHVGSEVEIVASISGSTLTLTTIKLDDNSSGNSGGMRVGDQGQMEAEGYVTTLGSESITIQPGDNASPATFAVPSSFTMPAGLTTGSVVEARGEMVNGVLTLTRIELQNDQGGQGELQAEGAVTALDPASTTIPGSVTIQPADSGSPITFTIPAGFTLPSGLAVGSFVDAQGTMVNGAATLTEIEVKSQSGSDK